MLILKGICPKRLKNIPGNHQVPGPKVFHKVTVQLKIILGPGTDGCKVFFLIFAYSFQYEHIF